MYIPRYHRLYRKVERKKEGCTQQPQNEKEASTNYPSQHHTASTEHTTAQQKEVWRHRHTGTPPSGTHSVHTAYTQRTQRKKR